MLRRSRADSDRACGSAPLTSHIGIIADRGASVPAAGCNWGCCSPVFGTLAARR